MMSGEVVEIDAAAVDALTETRLPARNLSLEEAMLALGARRHESLARHTRLQVGGPADWFLEAETIDDVTVARIVARGRALPVTVIGNGSRLVISDRGLRGLVIRLTSALAVIQDDGDGRLRAGAGVRLAELAKFFRARHAGGLEWAFGLPDSLGGAICLNLGGRDGAIGGVLDRVIVVGRGGSEELAAAECGFGSRCSRFTQSGEVVVAARVSLPDRPFNAELATRVMESRPAARLNGQAHCGPIFANPPGGQAAQLLEDCGLAGRSHGAAQFAPGHANFIINHGAAHAADVKALMDLAAAEVKRRFQIDLSPEVRILGEW